MSQHMRAASSVGIPVEVEGDGGQLSLSKLHLLPSPVPRPPDAHGTLLVLY